MAGRNKKTPAPPPRMSEGVRQDLELNGRAIDPATGALLQRDPDTGEITVTERGTE
jgi:hypothetical protein